MCHQKNWDSLTGYLARAGFWKQNQSINHYYTRLTSQQENPINSSIGLFWILVFTNSDNITFLLQWIAFILILFTLFKTLEFLNFKGLINYITVFTFATLGIVILEASSTQHDLILTFFILVILFYLLKTLKSEKLELKYIIIVGLATGLALGTKTNAFLYIPGFIILIILYGKNNKLKLSKFLFLILFSAVGLMLFTSYNFIQNYFTFGNFLGSSNDRSYEN